MEKILTRERSNSHTHHFEDGIEVWPCLCGETHENVYDWFHHTCPHNEADLVGLGPTDKKGIISACCAECGKVFGVDLTTLAP